MECQKRPNSFGNNFQLSNYMLQREIQQLHYIYFENHVLRFCVISISIIDPDNGQGFPQARHKLVINYSIKILQYLQNHAPRDLVYLNQVCSTLNCPKLLGVTFWQKHSL